MKINSYFFFISMKCVQLCSYDSLAYMLRKTDSNYTAEEVARMSINKTNIDEITELIVTITNFINSISHMLDSLTRIIEIIYAICILCS